MIDSGGDPKGRSLRHLVWRGLKEYPTVAILQFLEDPEVIVRSEAARRLHLRPERRVFDRAAQLLRSERVYKREIAAFVLGQLGTPKRPYKNLSTKALLHSLKSERNPVVRATIITALGQLKAAEALEMIVPFAKDRSPAVRGSVAFTIGMNYCKQFKKIPVSLQKLLQKLRTDKSRRVREDAALGMNLVRGADES